MPSNIPVKHATAQHEHLTLEKHGCCLLRDVLEPDTIALLAEELKQALDADRSSLVGDRAWAFGARNLAATWDGWRTVVSRRPVQQLLSKYVSESFGLVRILYFDKPPGQGWSLPWHRDLTIAVEQHIDPIAPFSKPTTKAGVPHVEATLAVLQHMLTLRLSLDPMTADNGPLLFIPGSHNDTDDMVGDALSTSIEKTAEELRCNAGDVFAMRPRTLHASRESNNVAQIHRRVVHMEFAPQNLLPHPWRWHTWKMLQ